MKFDEVTTQFVLTRHVIGYDVMAIAIEDLGRDEARAAGQIPGRRRKGDGRQHGEVQRTGSGSNRVLQEGRQEGLRARPERLPHLRAEDATSISTATTGRKARLSASTRSNNHRSASGSMSAEVRPVRQCEPAELRPRRKTAHERLVKQTLINIARWLQRRAENVAVALLCDHVRNLHRPDFFRYVLNKPVGWTEEVIITTWLWTVLWGAAFILARSRRDPFRHHLFAGLGANAARIHGASPASRSSSSMAFRCPPPTVTSAS